MAAFEVLAEDYDACAGAFVQDRHGDILPRLPVGAARALDAGCGAGQLALALADRAQQVIGLDISHAMIRQARQRQSVTGKRNVAFVIADLERLPVAEASFDLIVSVNALHHTRQDICVPSLRQAMKPGGTMVVSDIVWAHPRLQGSIPYQAYRAARFALRSLFSHGPGTMWRALRLRLNPAWFQHVRNDHKLTPGEFRTVFGRYLAGCEFEANAWRMVATWTKPARATPALEA